MHFFGCASDNNSTSTTSTPPDYSSIETSITNIVMSGGQPASSASAPPPQSSLGKKSAAQQPLQRPMDFSRYQRVHVALRVAYNGASYDGLARQAVTRNTVEETLLRACVRLRIVPNIFPEDIKDAPFEGLGGDGRSADAWVRFARCGRTDKGVSAMGNAVSMFVRGPLLPTATPKAAAANDATAATTTVRDQVTARVEYDRLLNRVLPPSIRVLAWCPVPDDFDARFSCKARVYRYFFDGAGLDLARMAAGARRLVGAHDFRNLCQMDVVYVSNFVREILAARVCDVTSAAAAPRDGLSSIAPQAEDGGDGDDDDDDAPLSPQAGHRMCYLEIRATAFLYHQIRCIMTILFSVGAGAERPSIVSRLLDLAEFPRKPQYPFADPLPLVLWDCEFDPAVVAWSADPVAQRAVLDELDAEADAARVRAAICQGMRSSIAGGGGDSTTTTTATTTTSGSAVTAAAAALSSPAWGALLFSSGSISTCGSTSYVPLERRTLERSYAERIAALSGKRKDRQGVNVGLAATRRQRDDGGDDDDDDACGGD